MLDDDFAAMESQQAYKLTYQPHSKYRECTCARHKNMPFWERVHSIPKKYFSGPISFNMKHASKYFLKEAQRVELFPATKISSTYTKTESMSFPLR